MFLLIANGFFVNKKRDIPVFHHFSDSLNCSSMTM